MKFNLKKLEQKKGIYLITESVYVPLPQVSSPTSINKQEK